MKAFKQLAGVLLAIVGAFALGYIALNRGEQINALWMSLPPSVFIWWHTAITDCISLKSAESRCNPHDPRL